ncbi:MAG: hypothetical protein R3C18_09490 [Planctomycetaceae bacterium]
MLRNRHNYAFPARLQAAKASPWSDRAGPVIFVESLIWRSAPGGVEVLILGINYYPVIVEQGVFDCPACRCERDYRRFAVKKWGTIYWIPLLPFGVSHYYVTCLYCATQFADEILDYDPR